MPSQTGSPQRQRQYKRGNEERVLRLDFTSGEGTVWFRRTGSLVGALGAEPDGTLLVLASDPLGLWLVAGPGIEDQIASMGADSETASDSRGVWLSNDKGIWLAGPNGEVVAVSPTSGLPAGECA
jgi:hypothetical protein